MNSGHNHSGAYVLRCSQRGKGIEKFSTWTPIAFAGIGELPPILASRCVSLRMSRKKPGEDVESFRSDEIGSILNPLRRKAARWALDNHWRLTTTDSVLPDGLTNRQADNVKPLLTIADVAGGAWIRRGREAVLKTLNGGVRSDPGLSVQLLADVKAILGETGVARIPTKDLVAGLHAMPDRPLKTCGRRGRPLGAHQLSGLFIPYGITSRTIRPSRGRGPMKGYMAEDFQDVLERYLPSSGGAPSVTSLQPTPVGRDRTIRPNPGSEPAVASRESSSKGHSQVPGAGARCNDVTIIGSNTVCRPQRNSVAGLAWW